MPQLESCSAVTALRAVTPATEAGAGASPPPPAGAVGELVQLAAWPPGPAVSLELLRLHGIGVAALIVFILVLYLYIRRLNRTRAQLRRSEARLRELTGNAPVVLFSLDRKGRFTFSDGSGLQALGLQPGEVVGRSAFEMYRDYPEVIDHLQRALNGESVRGEVTVQGIGFDVHYAPMFDERGAPSGVTGVATNVDKRHRAERSLRASEQRFRALVESAHDAIFVHDGQTILFANPAAAAIFGAGDTDELVGGNILDLVHPSDRQRVAERIDLALRQSGATPAAEITLCRRDGSAFAGETIGHQVQFGGRIAIQVVTRDVTERKRAREALAASEARFRALVEHSGEAIFVHDGDEILFANPAAVRLFGAADEDRLKQVPLFDLIGAGDRQRIRDSVDSIRESGAAVSVTEVAMRRVSGSPFHVDATGVAVDFGGREAVQVVARDVTERKRAQQALAASETRYRELFEHMSNGVVVLDAAPGESDFIIRGCNRAVERMEGLIAAQVIGRPLLDVFPKLGETQLPQVLRRVHETGEAESCSVTLHEHGRPTQWHENRVYRLPSGEIIDTYEDVTSRRRAERELAASEQRYRLIFQHSPLGIFRFDADGVVRDVNDAMVELFDSSREALVGFDMLKQAEDERVITAVETALTKGSCYFEGDYLSVTGGRRLPLRAFFNSIHDESGEVAGGVAIVEDYTARRQAELFLTLQTRVLGKVTEDRPMSEVLGELVAVLEERQVGTIGSILLHDPVKGCLHHAAGSHLPDAFRQGIEGLAVGDGVGSCGTAASRGKSVIVEDIASDPLWADYRDLALDNDLRACWSVPIRGGQGEILGTFAMYYREPRSPTRAELDLCEQAAHLAGIAIRRSRDLTALRGSEARFRQLFDQAPLGIGQADEQGRLFRVNPALQQMLGQTTDALAARPLSRFAHADDRDLKLDEYRRLWRGEIERFEMEKRYIRNDGEVVWAYVNTTAVADAGGQVAYAIVMLDDISARKRAEQQLQALATTFSAVSGQQFFDRVSSHLRNVLDMDCVVIGRVRDGEQVEVLSSACCSDCEVPAEYMLADTPCEQALSGQLCCYPEGVQRAFPRDRSLRELGAEGYLGFGFHAPDGHSSGVLVVTKRSPITNAETASRVMEVFGERIAAEIERLHIQEELIESRRRYRQLLAALPNGVVVFNRERIAYANDALLELLGKEDVAGMVPARLLPEAIVEQVGASLEQPESAAMPPVQRYIDIAAGEDEQTLPVEILASRRIEIDGAAYGMLVLRDARRQLERAQRKRKLDKQLAELRNKAALGEMGAALAHELKQPLSAISNYSRGIRRLLEPQSRPELQQAVDRVLANVERMNSHIREIRDFYEYPVSESGPVELDKVVEQSVEYCRQQIEEAGAEVVIELDAPRSNLPISGAELKQVLINLLSNAARSVSSNPSGRPRRIVIRSRHAAIKRGEELELAVADSGAGVPESLREHIFRPSFSRSGDGFGLGLAICRGLLEQQGGSVAVGDSEHGGAQFTVKLRTIRETEDARVVGT